MSGIWTMGELLVEVMRPRAGMSLGEAGEFIGPFPSGAPGIFIDTVSRLGHGAGIIGGVGRDDFGTSLLDRLRNDGVDTHLVVESDERSTGVAFVTYFADGSRKFIYHIGNSAAEVRSVPDLSGVGSPSFFHIMGCSLLASDPFRVAITKTMKRFVQLGARISFDPNIRVELLGGRSLESVTGPVMAHCSVLLPGEEEVLLLSGASSVEQAVEILFRNRRLEVVIVKRGSRGSTVFTREDRQDIGVFPVDAVDPTGAGDAFDAGFLCGLLESKPLDQCVEIATAAGALTAAAFGPMEGKISPKSVEAMIKGNSSIGGKRAADSRSK